MKAAHVLVTLLLLGCKQNQPGPAVPAAPQAPRPELGYARDSFGGMKTVPIRISVMAPYPIQKAKLGVYFIYTDPDGEAGRREGPVIIPWTSEQAGGPIVSGNYTVTGEFTKPVNWIAHVYFEEVT